jgi:hypothetical protein
MKNILIILILFGGVLSTSAQTISRDVISSSGGNFTAGAKQLDFTIGETVIATLETSGNMLTQGFQQPCPLLIPNTFLGIIAPTEPVQANSGFNLSANFIGSNLSSAQWYFSSSGEITDLAEAELSFAGSISGGLVTDTFNFDSSQTGVYSVKLVVTNICGVTAEVDFVYVVIYDASGGFITGGGWIHSPLGALVGTTAEGKANFGFVAKYRTGNNNSGEVAGNTNFKFKAGDFHFKSSDYEDMSLVISGERKATYRGSGTVNGSGDYDFMVTVIDGEAPGAGPYDVDSFRIKIWDGSPSNVVYDNELGVVENADSNTVLGGGSITIHKPRGNGNNRSSNEAVDAESIDSDLFEANIWPSPSDAYFNIDLRTGNLSDMVEVQVFDLIGKLVQVDSFDAALSYKFGERLPSGIYFVRISQAYDTKTIRIIKH